jgi:mannose-6-phosphate isomerase-like protein (cupin superfamily)
LNHIDLTQRLVRYADLRPCTTAFVDARTPGSDRKENFTIIGPGVAENPDQYVHISSPHGFNIGGARQPPRCLNSQHSHETAEVFIVHSGRWCFMTGEFGTDGRIELEPGDVISIPTLAFRGFENIGEDVGFLFSVLGGDHPGRVTWAPYVFAAAEKHGLVLLSDGSLVDTTHEAMPPVAARMPVTNDSDIAKLQRLDDAALTACVMRSGEMATSGGGLSRFAGFEESAVIGPANPAESMPAGKMRWPHGFHLRRLRVAAGALCPEHARLEEEVLLILQGSITVRCGATELTLRRGDTLTIPRELARSFSNAGAEPAVVFVVRGGDAPAAARWAPVAA